MRVLKEVLRAPFAGWTWRALLHIVSGLLIALPAFVLVVTLMAASGALLITFLGVPLLALTLVLCRGLGTVQRSRTRALLGVRVAAPEPIRPRGERTGAMALIGATLKNGAAWRHACHAMLSLPLALFSFITGVTLWLYGWALALYPLWHWVFPTYTDDPGLQLYGESDGSGIWLDTPVEITLASATGVVFVLLSPWMLRGLAALDRMLVVGLLGPSRLASEVRKLESARGTAVDTASADLRRIERDLHDGAQARLVALAMDLGLAKEKLSEDPESAAKMVDEAHGEVKLALQELRDLARGIHPAILTDRGLAPALSALRARCTVPTTLHTEIPHRPAPAIEAIAYFTVSELLQNISKHSHATQADVELWRTKNRLLIQITDNGQGGATTQTGTGLKGLADRLNSVDGLLLIHSPPGGPTTITIELPWRDPQPTHTRADATTASGAKGTKAAR
ncbi:sensor domain-containing protein [Streptomyces sp. XM4193]|uniref:sensor histidine kinase n=1 Tax=Streptomyces sp. XM4193 TaxID=2929782 RepID=UPI001FF8D400|nr:sensor histidine kinase [Streptomyces sp. XM4193]MCK1795376.1 sensor domain-containing protein [Streptomyces sp. XM4193]